MNNIKITIKKELRSIFRDKKTILMLLVYPLLIPAMIFLYSFMYSSDGKDTYNIGINYKMDAVEEELFNDIGKLKYEKYGSLTDMENAYREGDIVGYIYKENNSYKIYTNSDSQDGMYLSGYVSSYLDSYSTYLTNNYLINEGINLEEAYGQINYSYENLDGENYMLTLIFSVSFTYIIMSIVITTISMATAATAQEKENGTLETILTFPVKSSELIIGKYLASVIMGIIASFIGLILTVVSLEIASRSFEIFEVLNYSFSISKLLVSILVVISASALISGLGIALTAFAKTYKEAQSSAQVLTMLTIIPMFVSILNIEINNLFYLIPIVNYVQILMDIFTNNINYLNLVIVFISSLVYVFIVIKRIINQYKSEKVLFSK